MAALPTLRLYFSGLSTLDSKAKSCTALPRSIVISGSSRPTRAECISEATVTSASSWASRSRSSRFSCVGFRSCLWNVRRQPLNQSPLQVQRNKLLVAPKPSRLKRLFSRLSKRSAPGASIRPCCVELSLVGVKSS